MRLTTQHTISVGVHAGECILQDSFSRLKHPKAPVRGSHFVAPNLKICCTDPELLQSAKDLQAEQAPHRMEENSVDKSGLVS